jgi:hypothetical protein
MCSNAIHLLRSTATVVLLGAASAAAFSAPPSSSRPLILDTQRGISDGGTGGTELQTAPLLLRRAEGGQPIATPEGPQANGSTPYPYIVAPYIQVPGGAPTPIPQPRPRPTPYSP